MKTEGSKTVVNGPIPYGWYLNQPLLFLLALNLFFVDLSSVFNFLSQGSLSLSLQLLRWLFYCLKFPKVLYQELLLFVGILYGNFAIEIF